MPKPLHHVQRIARAVRRRPVRLGAALLALLGVAGPAAAAPACHLIDPYVKRFLGDHVLYKKLDSALEKRAIDNYLLRLDPSRSLLTRPERDRLAASLEGVFARVAKGDCDPLRVAHREFVRQNEHALQFVRDFVMSDAYVLDHDAELVLDPEERGYPADDTARDDLLRLLVHFQIANYIGNDMPLSEAKEKLVARYERRFRRSLETSADEIHASFLDAFASSLDPHSSYLDPRLLEDFRIGMSLSLEGIGVALSEQDGYSVAEHIIPGGAADKQGILKPEDKIIAVATDNEEYVDIIDMPLRDAVALIRGKAGTKVGLTILRQSPEVEKFNVVIERSKIDLGEQAASLRFVTRTVGDRELKLGVLALPSFYGGQDPSERQCTEDVARLLREASDAKVDGLVLDLSVNGGGLLPHAITVSGFFLRRGPIVGVEDAQRRRQLLNDQDEEILYRGPLVVHTTRISASASEILTGALKDYRRALIVGDDHTFGKGTVQSVTPLPGDNGAIKVTTAIFFRPEGRSTQHSGVEADVVIPSLLVGDDLGEKSQEYSLEPQATTPFAGKLVNAEKAGERWVPINPRWIPTLRQRSAQRVAANEKFREIEERLAEIEKKGGVLRLSELEAEQAEAEAEKKSAGQDAEDADGKDGTDAKKPTPQLEETLDVLADLVIFSSGETPAAPVSSPPAS